MTIGFQADVPEFRTEFQERVKKIAFTDSVHNFDLQDTSSPVKSWMISVSVFQFVAASIRHHSSSILETGSQVVTL